MNRKQIALIKKDIRGVTANKRLFPVLLVIPLMMAVVLPSIFVLTMVLAPADSMNDMQSLLQQLPGNLSTADMQTALLRLMLNSVIPMFFLLIPIMASSVMAASSFVGEKEKRTLETLFYSPLSLPEIFRAKILAAFFLSMAVSLISFVAMIAVVEVELWLAVGYLFVPSPVWPIILLLVAPALSLLAITLTVRGSAKAQTVEESQQRSVFLILPIIALVIGQFTGLLLINTWVILGLGVILALLALILMRKAFHRFDYQTLLH